MSMIDINYLLLLQNLREASAGVLNDFMMQISAFAELKFTFLVLAFVYWCIDKRAGQLMAFNVSVACWFNQWIKKLLHVERPWIKDGRIAPVEDAIAGAGGYSMPSGHTTRATANWGVLGYTSWEKKKKGLSVFFWVLVAAIMFSRNYLGVHTLLDVIAAFWGGIFLMIAIELVLKWVDCKEEKNNRDLMVCAVLGVIVFLPMLRYGCLSNAGAAYGFVIGWLCERRLVRFNDLEDHFGLNAILKRFLPGAAVVFFMVTSGTDVLAHIVPARYAGFFMQAATSFFIMFLWPLVFHINESETLGKKKKIYQRIIVLIVALVLLIGAVAGVTRIRRNMESASNIEATVTEAENTKKEEPVSEVTEVHEEPSQPVKVIAHRGYSGIAPENTLPAFALAIDVDADMVELDVQLTKDGQIVVFHDTDLVRITGQEGTIADYTYEELCEFDAGSWYGPSNNPTYAGEKIPTLAEVMTLLAPSDLGIYLELKDIGSVDGFAEAVAAEVDAYGFMGRVVFASFNYDYLQTIKAIDNNAQILCNTTLGEADTLLAEYPADYYGLYVETVLIDTIEKLHAADKTVYVWTANTAKDMRRCIRLGADGLVTNYPGIAKTIVAQDPDSFMEDVTILYTNDVHSYINNTDGLSYASVAALKKELIAKGENVILADAGDHAQGTAYGGMDEGASIISIMNATGYDVTTLGNHEFDYGLYRAFSLMEQAEFPYVSCNFTQTDTGECVLPAYQIIEVGGIKVAFVGISTPETLTKSSPTYFMDENAENYLYHFAEGGDGQEFYRMIQSAVDEASVEADYVIALGHLGVDESSSPYTSREVIANTTGFDAFIDGHSHSTIESEQVTDASGNSVILTQTGSHMNAIGKMTLGQNGVQAALITDYAGRDEQIVEMEQTRINEVEESLGKQIAVCEKKLYISDADNGNRLVRKAETNLGDLEADAIYYYFNETSDLECDVAIMNGGGIRSDIEAGEITYNTCKTVNPFGNVVCLMRVSGQQILDALEWGSRVTGADAECGGFLQVAGMKYTIDTGRTPNVVEGDDGIWCGRASDDRLSYRVTEVEIYNRVTNEYEPIVLDKLYDIAGVNYTLRNFGDGFFMFKDAEVVLDYAGEDYMILASYLGSFSSGADGYPVVSTENSPLSGWNGYLLDYENPTGAGRIVQ